MLMPEKLYIHHMTITRWIAFLLGCIGTRTAITYIAYVATPDTLRALGYLALVPALGFSVIFAGNLRQTGPEVGGERIWWNSLRPVHAALLFAFAYFAIIKNRSAWTFLLADTVLGLTATMHHRSR